MKYAMFLRGINVGNIRVPMADLRSCLNNIGLADISTYLQTGNVTFESTLTEEKLKPLIEQQLTQTFNYTAYILLYPQSILEGIITAYPFQTEENTHRYAIFCDDQATIDSLMSVRDSLDHSTEDIAAGEHVVYWRVPKGMTLDTAFSKHAAKPQFKAVTTNRNLNTLQKMI